LKNFGKRATIAGDDLDEGFEMQGAKGDPQPQMFTLGDIA